MTLLRIPHDILLPYLGREFTQIGARLENAGGNWRGTLDSPLIAGAVEWRAEGRGRLIARLDRLAVPEAPQDAAAVQPASQDPPALDVTAEHFHFRGRELGKLELKADYTTPGSDPEPGKGVNQGLTPCVNQVTPIAPAGPGGRTA